VGSRLKWAVGGAMAAALTIAGSSVLVQQRQQRAEALREETDRIRKEAEELRQRNDALAAEAARLEAERRELVQVVERLNVEHRVAQVEVMQQHTDLAGKVVQTVLRLTELDREGKALAPRIVGVPSPIPHFDALVIKFDREHVARGDALRGRSLALFRRVYGDNQAPEDGYWLNTPGEPPDVYRVARHPSEFERRLWRDFWKYATDPEFAAAEGVRVAQGESVYAPMSVGESWTLTLEANGGLSLKKKGDSATTAPTTATAKANLHAPPPIASQEHDG
jgi:hypothetical protein